VVVYCRTAAAHKLLNIFSVVESRKVLHAMLLMNFKAAAIKKAAERKRPYGDVRIGQPDDITCVSMKILAYQGAFG
jgi:hypothetical protein